MNPDPSTPSSGWDEQNSQDFLRYGRYFVPGRERQLRTIVSLLPAQEAAGAAFDVCCGEALLAEAILGSRPGWTVYGRAPLGVQQGAQDRAGHGRSARGARTNHPTPRIIEMLQYRRPAGFIRLSRRYGKPVGRSWRIS